MKSARGIVLYVGKAKNLRRRLSSYFHKKKHKRRRIGEMVKQVRQIEVIIVRNETESLILETNLIKHYLPKFNRAKKSKKTGLPIVPLMQIHSTYHLQKTHIFHLIDCKSTFLTLKEKKHLL